MVTIIEGMLHLRYYSFSCSFFVASVRPLGRFSCCYLTWSLLLWKKNIFTFFYDSGRISTEDSNTAITMILTAGVAVIIAKAASTVAKAIRFHHRRFIKKSYFAD